MDLHEPVTVFTKLKKSSTGKQGKQQNDWTWPTSINERKLKLMKKN